MPQAPFFGGYLGNFVFLPGQGAPGYPHPTCYGGYRARAWLRAMGIADDTTPDIRHPQLSDYEHETVSRLGDPLPG